MKKKLIEKIAPNTLENPGKKPYQAVPSIVDIDGVQHLLVDIYERRGKEYEFIMRAAYNAFDWGLWNPDTRMWSGRSIEDPLSYKPTYDQYDMLSGPGLPKKASWKNTRMSRAGFDTVVGFYKSTNPLYEERIQEGEWWKALKGIEREAKSERERKARENREKSLMERSADVPDTPADFAEWADQTIYGKKELIYYKRKGRFADCQCSRCGAKYRIINRPRDGIDGMLERVDPVPVNNENTRCLKCGAEATYKPSGRMKYRHEEYGGAYLIQPYRVTGSVIRYFRASKVWILGEISHVNFTEIGRTYIDSFKKVKQDWHLVDGWNGACGWYDHNVGSIGNISYQAGYVYDRNQDEWTSRSLMYCGLKEFMEADGTKQKPTDFIATAQDYGVEKMVKIGLTHLTKRLVGGETWNFRRGKYKRIEDTLGIRRARLSLLTDYDDMNILRALQLERENIDDIRNGRSRGKGEWTEEQVMKASAMRLSERDFIDVLHLMTITQLINRVEHYIGREIKAGDPKEQDAKAVEIATLYKDYLKLRIEHGMDMERSTSVYPKDLREAHRKTVNAVNAAKNNERLEKLETEYPDVKRRYRKIRNMYGYKAGEYFIRPAKNIREILEEGQVLHHCVGASDMYISRHNRGSSAIFFLRRILEPNEPYITVEFNGVEVVQWFGRNDTKPDEKNMQKWIDAWVDAATKKQEAGAGYADGGTIAAAV